MINISGKQKLTGKTKMQIKTPSKSIVAGLIALGLFLLSAPSYAKISIKNPFQNLKRKPKAEKVNPFQRPPLADRKDNYLEIKNSLRLNNKELSRFSDINIKESWALRPLALDLEAKYLRQDELNAAKCRFYQRTCKKELKKDKAFLASDIKELKRRIWQKKEYYKILYLNETTRRQDLMLRHAVDEWTGHKPQLW